MIVLAASNRELNTFVIVVDNLSSYETCKIIEPPIWDLQDLAGLLAPFAPSATALQPSEKPFAGWRGGRPRRVLSDEEKAQIAAARADGKTIDAIAAEMHISNRVVSAHLKLSK